MSLLNVDNRVFMSHSTNHFFLWSAWCVFLLLVIAAVLLAVRNKKLKSALNDVAGRQSALQQNIAELRDSLAFKDSMLYIISHDAKGPVASLLAYMELQEKTNIQSDVAVPVKQYVVQQLTSVYQLLGNMLQWSSETDGRSRRKFEGFPLFDLVEQNVMLINGYNRSKGISVINAIPHDLKMYGIKNELDVVFRNLLFNAVKYTNDGGVVKIYMEDIPLKVQIKVEDNGVGMPAARAEQLFNKKENLTTVGTNGERGNGLGLAICKDFVQQNKGEIHVDSEENVGTIVTLEFPYSSFV